MAAKRENHLKDAFCVGAAVRNRNHSAVRGRDPVEPFEPLEVERSVADDAALEPGRGSLHDGQVLRIETHEFRLPYRSICAERIVIVKIFESEKGIETRRIIGS